MNINLDPDSATWRYALTVKRFFEVWTHEDALALTSQVIAFVSCFPIGF